MNIKLVVRGPRIKSVAKVRTFLTKMEAFKRLKKRLLLLSVRKWFPDYNVMKGPIFVAKV